MVKSCGLMCHVIDAEVKGSNLAITIFCWMEKRRMNKQSNYTGDQKL